MMNTATREKPTMFSAIIVLVLLSGCGGAHEASVLGTATLDGKPLTSGTVTFYPMAGGAPAYAQIQSDGSYALSTGAAAGLAPGEYAVTVVAAAPPAAAPPAVAPPAVAPPAKRPPPETLGVLLTPARYGNLQQTDLRFTVIRGANRIALELKSP